MVAPRTAAELAPVLVRLEPDVVVYEQYDVGAAVAAHRAGITALCHSLSPRPPDEVAEMIAGALLDSFDVFAGDVFLDTFPTCLQQPSFLDHPARLALRPIPPVNPRRWCPSGSAAAIGHSST